MGGPATPGTLTGDVPPERGALVAGLRFIEGVGAGWMRSDLVTWLNEDLVGPGRMTPVSVVHEAVVGAIALDPATSAAAERPASLDALPKLLAVARSRVVVTLRAFVSTPPDDRFLQAAIFHERVQRVRGDRVASVWVARPTDKDLLSDVVLSLFAADILMHREFHEQSLCVCEPCGRVSFQPATTGRSGCVEHPVRGASGFVRPGSTPSMRRVESQASLRVDGAGSDAPGSAPARRTITPPPRSKRG